MLDELSMIYEKNLLGPHNAMGRIIKESERKRKLNMKSWTTDIYFNNDYDHFTTENEGADDDDEDNEDEDDEGKHGEVKDDEGEDNEVEGDEGEGGEGEGDEGEGDE